MDHSHMNHSSMDHSNMIMDNSQMDPSIMNYNSTDTMHGHSAMDHSSGDMSHNMMEMYFHFSTASVILFKEWTTSSWTEMLGSCIAIFIMAALYEGLKVYREHLLMKAVSNQRDAHSSKSYSPSVENTLMDHPEPNVRNRMLSLAHVIQTVLHIIQVVVSYFLMLIFMTYNIWLCLAVALGAGFGYFLFGWKRATVIDIHEHCH